MLKKYKGCIITFYIAATASLIAAAFLDLKIDIMLNAPQNPFAIWFCNTGEIPSRLICPLGGLALYYLGEKKSQKIPGLIFCIGGSAYTGIYLADYFFVEENNILFGIVFGLGIGAVLLFAGKYISVPEDMKKPLCVLAVIGIIVMFVQIGAIEGMKYLWGRVRFRDLLAAGSYEQFTAWYHPNGINGNKSFPSGHTAGAGMSYLIMVLPMVFKKFRGKEIQCFACAFVYTSVVAFTRLVMGAHYLSDVTVGGIISFSLVLIAMAIIEKKHNDIVVI